MANKVIGSRDNHLNCLTEVGRALRVEWEEEVVQEVVEMLGLEDEGCGPVIGRRNGVKEGLWSDC